MAEDTNKKKPTIKRKPRPRPVHAVEITVWDMSGVELTDDVVAELETALDAIRVEQFNNGVRLLTQTNRG